MIPITETPGDMNWSSVALWTATVTAAATAAAAGSLLWLLVTDPTAIVSGHASHPMANGLIHAAALLQSAFVRLAQLF